MSYSDYESLNTEITNGQLEMNVTQIDTYKLMDALRFLATEIQNLKIQMDISSSDISFLQSQIHTLQNENNEYKYLFKAISKDYPEVVFSKPHLFDTPE